MHQHFRLRPLIFTLQSKFLSRIIFLFFNQYANRLEFTVHNGFIVNNQIRFTSMLSNSIFTLHGVHVRFLIILQFSKTVIFQFQFLSFPMAKHFYSNLWLSSYYEWFDYQYWAFCHSIFLTPRHHPWLKSVYSLGHSELFSFSTQHFSHGMDIYWTIPVHSSWPIH